MALAGSAFALPSSAVADPVPLAQVGSFGEDAGELQFPADVTVDGAGNLYVSENGNNRIAEFTSDGSFIRAFGFDVTPPDDGGGLEVCTATTGCQQGDPSAGAGALNSPNGIALDASGNLWVADTNNHRISEFTAAGSFVQAFGLGVASGGSSFQVCTTTCQGGTSSSGAGAVEAPFGLALDGGGNLYVADFIRDRISQFSVSGTPSFIQAFGWDVAPPSGDSAFEVCTTGTGCETGASGGGAGQLDHPYDVALDGAGNLDVADNSNHRVSEFSVSGTPSFVRAFGFDVTPPDDGGGLEVCTTSCLAGDQGGAAGQLDSPAGLAPDGAGNLYVSEASNVRISRFSVSGTPSFAQAFGWGVATGANAFEVCTSTCLAGSSGGEVGQLAEPQGIAIDCRGAVWVADNGNGRLQRFGEPGTPLPPCPLPGGGGAGAAQPSSTLSKPPNCQGKAATIVGTNGADTLKGTKKADVIAALRGRDKVSGLGGNDRVCAGAGKDRVSGGEGKDRLKGEKGADRLAGNAGKDVLKGGPGRDTLIGGPGIDTLAGGAGADIQKQ